MIELFSIENIFEVKIITTVILDKHDFLVTLTNKADKKLFSNCSKVSCSRVVKLQSKVSRLSVDCVSF